MLQQLMADAGRDLFAGVFDEPTPEVGAVPERVRGFRVRVDLMYAKPPIWRRLVLPGDLVLDELHDVLQVAMGWQDGHLHKFGVGADRRTRVYFVTRFDLSEGDDGLVEDGVRLDQVVSGKGDRLFYDYDFGDGWEHVLVVEDIVDTGLTLAYLIQNLKSRNPASIEVMAMFRKPEALRSPVEVKYIGYDLPNEFVVGYGLDYAGQYRNLRDLGTLSPHVYS